MSFAFLDWLAGPAWQSLVLALAHTLWQGAVVAGAVVLSLRGIPTRHHNARYWTALGAEGAMLMAALVTWAILGLDHAPTSKHLAPRISRPISDKQASAALPKAAGSSDPDRAESLSESPSLSSTPARWTGLAVVGWLAGVAAMLVRMGILLVAGRRSSRGEELSTGPVAALVHELGLAMGIRRRVRVIVTLAAGPAVSGILWPVILLPTSLSTGVPPETLQLVLAHELAHIRRQDYLWNLLQMILEAVLFFNPAVWWLSRQVRTEREACCDALAVAATGEPIRYSHVLADWADQASESATVAVAWADRRRPLVLLDRVRRILQPGYRPEVRVTPAGLASLLLVSTLALAGLWRGTSAAVVLAAEILSPTERLEQLSTAQQKYAASAGMPEGKFTLSGTVVTPEGKPIQEQILASLLSRTGSSTSLGSVEKLGAKFSITLPCGVNWLVLYPKDYAPSVVGPVSGKPGERLDGVKIVLDPGFAAKIRVTDKRGLPVAGARVFGVPDVERSFVGPGQWLTTDAEGQVVLQRASTHPYGFNVKAAGFEDRRAENVRLQPGKLLTLALARSPATSGIVVAPDGTPIAAAKLIEFAKSMPGGTSILGQQGPVLATTDRSGRFLLDSLSQNATYTLWITTEKHGTRLVGPIRAGQTSLRWTVGPERTLSGTILGDLKTLKQEAGHPIVSVSQPVQRPEGNYPATSWKTTITRTVPVEPAGNQGRFLAGSLLPGEVWITAGNHQRKIEENQAQSPVVIDLDQPACLSPKRQVVLRLVTPDGEIAPQGNIEIDSYEPERIAPWIHKTIQLNDGRATFEAYAPGRLSYRPSGVIGYWFQDGGADVLPGDGPLELKLSVIPAGAISGQVLAADGSPAVEGVEVSYATASEAPQWQGRLSGIRGTRVDANGRFFLTPLPLGGSYLVTAFRGHNKQVCPPVSLDAAHPNRVVTVRLPKPMVAQGQVLGPDGQPLADLAVELEFRYPQASHGWHPPVQTDAQGRFQFNDINAEVGQYWIEISSRRTHQPAALRLRTDGQPTVVHLQQGYVLEGRVVDARTGLGIPNVEMYAHPTSWQPGDLFAYDAEAKTDAEGQFRFSNLPAGPVDLNDRSGLRWAQPNSLQKVTSDGSSPLVLQAAFPDRKQDQAP